MARRVKGVWTDTSGNSTIELAFVLPVLLLFLFGAIEFGRFYWIQNQLQYSVEQTARESLRSAPAIADCSTSVASSAAVMANAVALSSPPAVITLAVSTNTGSDLATPPKSCQITITYPFSFFGFLDLGNITAYGVAAFPCGTGTICT